MALLKLALLASFALLASLPSAQADDTGVDAAGQSANCVYVITSSDSPLYVLEPNGNGWETFVGVPDESGSYVGVGVGYTGGPC